MSRVHKETILLLERTRLKKTCRTVNWCVIQNEEKACFIMLEIFIEHHLHVLECGAHR